MVEALFALSPSAYSLNSSLVGLGPASRTRFHASHCVEPFVAADREVTSTSEEGFKNVVRGYPGSLPCIVTALRAYPSAHDFEVFLPIHDQLQSYRLVLSRQHDAEGDRGLVDKGSRQADRAAPESWTFRTSARRFFPNRTHLDWSSSSSLSRGVVNNSG